jgi:hypothetical protein
VYNGPHFQPRIKHIGIEEVKITPHRPWQHPAELETLVVRLAQENRTWGYARMVGPLKHLGYRISDQTVGIS